MPDVHVQTRQREYDVIVQAGLLSRLGSLLLTRRQLPARVVLVSDENVAPLYAAQAVRSLSDSGFDVTELLLPAGEQHKRLERVYEMYGVFYERHLRRSDVVLALGGGVVGDMAGYAAATYLRGIGLVQAPTTLLAQVDAAVGGKVGVDFRAGKNHVGTFYQPLVVAADPDLLATLPLRELHNGAAEVIKYGFLAGGRLLEQVEASVAADRYDAELVRQCVALKARVVERDEREEGGERQLLNLGHTIGHAIEAAGGFNLYSHGEAVGLGLRAALQLSRRLAGLSISDFERAERLLALARLPDALERVSPEEVVSLVERDKKSGPHGVEFVLLEALGRARTGASVQPSLLEEVVRWLRRV